MEFLRTSWRCNRPHKPDLRSRGGADGAALADSILSHCCLVGFADGLLISKTVIKRRNQNVCTSLNRSRAATHRTSASGRERHFGQASESSHWLVCCGQ